MTRFWLKAFFMHRFGNITMNSDVIIHASKLWSYLASFHCKGDCDAVVICCSYDLRICDYACRLLKDGLSDTLIISGKSGNWTRQLWNRSEAEIFAARAQANGINSQHIVIEDQATNIGENIANSTKLLRNARTITFVTKPNTLLRVKLTVPIHAKGVCAYTAGPAMLFPDEVSNIVGVFGVIDEMVGDLERIVKYPALGYQIHHDLPDEIIDSWRFLIEQGFTRHML